ncbi:guanyl-specific ribonuclease Th1 [Trichophyton rubrum D6]|uniref:ribonuclease T1 n=4 Tax=Trichophyton TaxID=5550 RepID=F2SWM2_TRIRC|nr:guanyl-specific ribonuclease Th1 [Trichophyton rubrum CBS 118892]EZF25615.1 guanyl-specific ribonuclease Th1 [Trichophyton rubrum MR850]EZF44580.1 guanyl-specific ribonuclease Th1 [Trichophyton rubrum CBS 100081]EZF55179.1 guanyl-specific ribonuclease Th1 [Trichophyton rubrum CBS 288.86]EZF65851.1 guanyl-specific ribonuclease Th1 [Trichophyton rubrum CBS 289.86]EZF76437.1 guanyl-specific ribonuclease Th1 [Trichophyton soudanense CBS 452.61]EZF87112.1 guanyl-specific ribonuclease Th1 [Trich
MKFLALLSLVTAATAAPAALEARGATTCGSTSYSASQVTAASNAACNYVQSGTTAGGSTYPHQYRNYEGFYFNGLSGPFYEFPLRTSGVYNGGSPGADRVIITGNCDEAGQITHTGASGNGFVACSGTS